MTSEPRDEPGDVSRDEPAVSHVSDVFAADGPLGRTRILPVVTIDDADDAVDLVAALVRGGLHTVEITLRTPAALDAIARAAAGVPAAVVGAGSVTKAAKLNAAADAGARFAVSPGIDDRVIDAAHDRGIPLLPGIATATELMHALDRAVEAVKVFPVGPLGGPSIIEAFAAVWPDARFVPTGGILSADVAGYLAIAQVLAVGGSWMVPRAAVAERDWASITRAAAAAVRIVGGPA